MTTLKRKFRSAIRRGTGETHILLRENPTVDFSSEIIKASLFNFAQDQQSEGGREVYLAELINLSAQKNEILPVIYKVLGRTIDDDWSVEQLFDIVAIFAKQGDESAKEVIHKSYYKYAMDNAEWAGRDAVIESEGLDGLKYVAETTGKMLENFPDRWEDSFFVDHFQKENPSIDVYGELRNEAKNNRFIKKYLNTIEENKFAIKKRIEPKFDYKYAKNIFENTKIRFIGPRISQSLSKGDLKKLADDFLQETSRLSQAKYLSVFSRVKFPYEYQPILKLAKAKISKNDRLVELAVKALQFFTAEDIRQFAVEKISVTNQPASYTDLLIGNYREGDWELLKSIAEKYKNNNIIHSLGWSYIDIYKANPTKECREPLEIIYNKMTCGLHRTDLVEILIENDVLSEKIRDEIQFDCNERTRKLI